MVLLCMVLLYKTLNVPCTGTVLTVGIHDMVRAYWYI